MQQQEKFGNVAPRRRLKTDPVSSMSHTGRPGPALSVQGMFTYGSLINQYSEIGCLYVPQNAKTSAKPGLLHMIQGLTESLKELSLRQLSSSIFGRINLFNPIKQ
jgi:hypothetical protein